MSRLRLRLLDPDPLHRFDSGFQKVTSTFFADVPDTFIAVVDSANAASDATILVLASEWRQTIAGSRFEFVCPDSLDKFW